MRLATWNVNSIRARQGLVVDWLADQVPDVCCLQETKCNDATFPAAAFESLGYEVGHQAPPERAALQALLDLGFHDLAREHAPHERQFTWWN